ncbi:MAG: zf-HC2 domain-containing protein, partial [Planctomycetota bacterium]
MKCTSEAGRFSEDLGALLDAELAPERHAEIEGHLEACESCREELVRLKKLSGLVGALPRDKAPGALAASIMSAVTSSGAPSGGASDVPLSDRAREAAPRSKVLQLRRWVGGITAAAAVLLVGIVGVAVLRNGDSSRRSEFAPDASAPSVATRALETADAVPEEAAGEPSARSGWYGKGAGDGAGGKAETDVADAMVAAKRARASGGAATAPAASPAAPAVRAPAEPVPADRGGRADVLRDAAATRPET